MLFLHRAIIRGLAVDLMNSIYTSARRHWIADLLQPCFISFSSASVGNLNLADNNIRVENSEQVINSVKLNFNLHTVLQIYDYQLKLQCCEIKSKLLFVISVSALSTCFVVGIK